MKKIILPFCLVLSLAGKISAQGYDDGFVTNGLPVKTTDPKFATFSLGLKEGIEKVATGQIISNDDVVQVYGVNLHDFPKLDNVLATGNTGAYNNQYSLTFLSRLQTFSRNTNNYENILQLRTALKNMASVTELTTKEAEAVAAIDISVQEVARRFLPSVNGASYHTGDFSPIADAALFYSNSWKDQSGAQLEPFNYVKLPNWVRCALGIIGEAIMGGFSGARIGAMVGGPIGAVVMGIIGVVGGTFKGFADYCTQR